MVINLKSLYSEICILSCLLFPLNRASAKDKSPVAYKIAGKTITVDEARAQDLGAFYNLEKKMYDLISHRAELDFLEYFWQELGKATGKTPNEAQISFEEDMMGLFNGRFAE